MIPILVVPHLNHPELLAEMLGSIDVPVGRLVIVDNAMSEEDSAYAVEASFPANTEVVQPGWNLGVAASWNLGIKVAPYAAWWAFANNDVTFAPDDLARLAEFMDAAHRPTIGMLVEFGAFAINAACLERIGWFDENYHPIYAEDADYRHRAELAGVDTAELPSTTRHAGSMCFRDGPRARDNERTYPANVAYHVAKWGGPPWHEVHATPFGDPKADIGEWKLDVRRLRDQAW